MPKPATPGTARAKQAEAACRNSEGRAMLHAPGIIGNMHGAGRPVVVIKSELTRLATKWASAFLAGQELPALQHAHKALQRHPEHASNGYSVAKSALQRVEGELARRAA